MNLDELNPQQRIAVETTEGPLLILAGAGSGKTKVLTYRIAHILEQKLTYPEGILAVTFTNKAAGEMKQRIAKILGSNISLPWMGTFHSICVKILKRDGHRLGLGANFSIYDPSDQLDCVKEAMERLNISVKEVNPRAVHSHISNAKNELISPEDYASFANGYFQEIVGQIFPVYQAILRENNAVDFDDLLAYTVKLLQTDKEALEKYQELYKYILVDEYQDTNQAQYILVNLFAAKYKNICCVGDDDQSIYSFRGANIRNILNFHRDYPNASIIKLEQNYRSTQKILDAAHSVVRKNKNRTEKELWTDNDRGDNILIYTAESERQEAEWMVTKAQELIRNGVHADDIAVLYRTNAQSRSMEEACVRFSLPYRIIGGVRFYERKEIKDILAYLRILYNNDDDGSLKRIINVPRRNVGPKAVSDLQAKAKIAGTSMIKLLMQENIPQDSKGVGNFGAVLRHLIDKTQELNIVDLLNEVLEKTEYIQMLDDGTAENEARIENIQELISVAAKYIDAGAPAGLAMFLDEVSLLEEDKPEIDENGAVTMMTIHAAKGLEFEHVFLVGMEEGLFPHSRVFTDPTELEEERRLAYVAITRAKKNLYMIHADSRLFFGQRQNNMPSRFMDDIPDELKNKEFHSRKDVWEDVAFDDGWSKPVDYPKLQSGDRVKHEFFGTGTVVGVSGELVKIKFGSLHGTKELSMEFAPLQKI